MEERNVSAMPETAPREIPSSSDRATEEAASPSGYRGMADYWELITGDHADHEAEMDNLELLLRRHGAPRSQSFLDLGCGSGVQATILASRGYDVTGIDCEPDMIQVARNRAGTFRIPPRFEVGDMRSFDMGRTYDVAYSWRGAVDHLLRDDDFESMLGSVRRHVPKGVFIFEFWQNIGLRPHVEYWEKHHPGPQREVLYLQTIRYDPVSSILTREAELYALDFGAGKLEAHSVSTVRSRMLTIRSMGALVERGGFEVLGFYDATQPWQGPVERAHPAHQVLCVCRPRRPFGASPFGHGSLGSSHVSPALPGLPSVPLRRST